MPSPEIFLAHTPITDPRHHASLVARLPNDLPRLVQAVQGLLIFPYFGWAERYGIGIDQSREGELAIRTIADKLDRILELNPSPLDVPRSPEQRLYGRCGDFAVLLTAFLRHHGHPARTRVGFGGYFDSDKFWDHRVTEVWLPDENRWRAIDPRVDAVQLPRMKPTLDPMEVTADSPYLVAGEVWRSARRGKVDPQQFGDSPTDLGMNPIRWALLQDFSSLAGYELLGSDALHPLIEKPHSELSDGELELLDRVAEFTCDPDTHQASIRRLHGETKYGQSVEEVCATSLK